MTNSKEVIAKAGFKLADISHQVTEFLLKVVAAPVTQLAGIAEDWMCLFRYQNLLVIADKVDSIHKDRKIQGKPIPIPPKYAIPIIEAASLEEEEQLQDLWARLIANATDPNLDNKLHPAFCGVIKNLSSDEALIIKSLSGLTTFPTVVTYEKSSHSSNSSPSFLKFGNDRQSGLDILYLNFGDWCSNISLHDHCKSGSYLKNLEREGILEVSIDVVPEIKYDPFYDKPEHRMMYKQGHVELESIQTGFVRVTKFGEDLLNACGLMRS